MLHASTAGGAASGHAGSAVPGRKHYVATMSENPPDRASLEREIRARQDSLAATVDELAGRVAPKALAQSGVDSAKEAGASLVLDDDGALRLGRIGAVVGGIVGLVGLSVLARRRG